MSLPIHVFLDSSFMHTITPDSIMSHILQNLSRTGSIKVHVHYLVEQEIRTQIIEARSKHGQRDYSYLGRWLPEESRKQLLSAMAQARELASKSNILIEKAFADWLLDLGAVRDSITEIQTVEVFKLYFSGQRPFRSVKNRNDLPDAFIYASIKEFAHKHKDTIHVVVEDSHLRESLNAIPGVCAHKSCKEIFSLPEIQPKATLSMLLHGFERTIDAHISKIHEKIRDRILDAQIAPPLDIDFDDVSECHIAEPGEISNLHVDESKAELLSENSFSAPFSCEAIDCRIVAEVSTSELYINDHDTNLLFFDDPDSKYQSYTAHTGCGISGNIIVELDCIDGATRGIENVDIEINGIDTF